MAVKVVARGEEAKKRLTAKGVTPGKVGSSVTYRKGGKVRKKVSFEGGEAVRTETYDYDAGMVSIEEKGKAPALNSAPGTGAPEQQFTDASGRVLTDYESYNLRKGVGGQSTYKPGTFSQEGTTVYYSAPMRNKQNIVTAMNISGVKNVQDIQQAARSQNRLVSLDAQIQEAVRTGDEGKLRLLQEERRSLVTERLRNAPPVYGKFEPLKTDEKLTAKRYGEQALGLVSKGFTTVGKGAEMALQDVKEREQMRVLWEGQNKADLFAINVAQGAVRGGVTNIGQDKITAGLFLGAPVIGAGIGAASQALKGASITLTPGAARSASWALKGVKRGFTTGTLGIVGVSIAASDNKAFAIGQLAGTGLAIGTTYRAGSQLGKGAVMGIQNIELTKLGTRVSSIKPGTALTTQQARDVTRYARLSSATGEPTIAVGAELKGVKARSYDIQTPQKGVRISRYEQVYGREVPINKGSGADLLRVDYVAGRANLYQGSLKGSPGSTYVKPSPGQAFIAEKGTGFTTTKDFNRVLANPLRSDAMIIEPSITSPGKIQYAEAAAKVTAIKSPYGGTWLPPDKALTGQTALPGASLKALPSPADYIVIKTPSGVSGLYAARGQPPVTFTAFRPASGLKSIYSTGGGSQTQIVLSDVEVVSPVFAGGATATVSKAKTAQTFRPLSDYQGGSARLNPFYDYNAPGSFTQEFFNEVKITPRPNIGITTEPGATSIPAVEPTIKPRTFTFSGGRVSPGTGTTPSTDIGTDISSDTSQDISSGQDTSQTPSYDIAEEQAQRTDQSSSQRYASDFSRINIPKYGFTPGKPGKTRTPTIFKPGFPRRGDSIEKGGVFQSFARVGGKFKFIGLPTSSKAEAFKSGSFFVEGTPARTFGVANLRAGKDFKGLDFSETGGKKYKKKKGAFGFLFIEPSKRAINAPGELKGITFKGISMKRRK